MLRFEGEKPRVVEPAETLLVDVPSSIASPMELFKFLAVKLQFPGYFGENWDAMDECLADLSWLKVAKVVLFHDGLPLSSKKDQRIYLDILDSLSAEHLAVPVEAVFPAKYRERVEAALNEERFGAE